METLLLSNSSLCLLRKFLHLHVDVRLLVG